MISRRNLKRLFYKSARQPLYAFSVFKRRIKAYLCYSFKKGKSVYPEAITLFLTHRCNLQCRMCGQWGKEGVTKKRGAQYVQSELTADQLRSVVDGLSSFKSNITLFGGEPLLHQDCIDIIKYIKQKGLHCLVITNGFLIEELAKQLVDSGLDELNVSLDGNAVLHDEIRGMKGLFDKITNGLKQIHHFKAEMKKLKPFVNLQCTITQYNYNHLEQLIDVAGEANADSLTFHNLIFLDSTLLAEQRRYDKMLGCDSVDWEGFVFKPGINPQVLYEKMKKIL